MLDRLPKYVDPTVLADRNACLEGSLPLVEMDRLGEILTDSAGRVSIKLNFARQGKWVFVDGQLDALLYLKCQRCLEAIEWPVNSAFKLGVVRTLAQADLLPEGVEPLLLSEEEKIVLQEVIEDELLLNLPVIPKHQEQCEVPSEAEQKPIELGEKPQTNKANPFAILANFKTPESNNGSTEE